MEQLQYGMLQAILAAILIATVRQLMPDGAVKTVGNFLGGVIFLLVCLSSFKDIESWQLPQNYSAYQQQIQQETENYILQQNDRWYQLIEENTAAYIEDKAAELGLLCEVSVQVSVNESGVPRPESVIVRGAKDSRLISLLTQQLGIIEEQQLWLEH